MTLEDLRASQSALLASIAASADAAREMIAASNLPGATAVLEQIAVNARDVATALSLPNRQGADLPTDPDAVAPADHLKEARRRFDGMGNPAGSLDGLATDRGVLAELLKHAEEEAGKP